MSQEDALARLARQIDAAKKSEYRLRTAEEVGALRRSGAASLHATCAEFVALLNSRLSNSSVSLDPPTYEPANYREPGANLIQISSQGREMQIVFQAPPQLVSTEKFPVPYILEGEVRTYNQQMLERFDVRSQLLFYCLEENTAAWRFFDWRLPRALPVNRDLLVSLMERLF